MKLLWLLVSLAVTFATALVLNLFFGPSGMYNYAKLAQANTTLEANVAENEAIRARLLAAVDGLQHDPDRIRLEARAQGYYLPDEHVVRIRDYPIVSTTYGPGRIILVQESNHSNRDQFRIIAICVGLVCFLLLISIERHAERRQRPKPPASAE